MEEVLNADPQVLKLQDKVRLLRHRCCASIGNSSFDAAMDYLTQNAAQSAQEKRTRLCQILGDESIGYWAIMDQIMFYEDLIAELGAANSTTATEN